MEEQTLVQLDTIKKTSNEIYDIVVIGGGPAGLSAALCAGRAKLNVLLIDRTLPGGATATACLIDNYLGFPGGILGEDLSKKMESHVTAFGTNYTCESVEDIIDIRKNIKIVKTDLENQYKCKTVIIATGLEPKRIELRFEKQFLGRGLSYYAKSDAMFYLGKDVAVVGGGNCACYAADYLSNFVEKIYLIHRSGNIKAVRTLKDKIESNPKIDIIWDSKIVDIFGVEKIEKVKLLNTLTNQHTWLNVKALFVYDGRFPPQTILHPEIKVDEGRYIVTDEFMRTSISGVYAAGDNRAKQIRQIPTAVADGMIAAINAERDFLK